MSVTRSELVTMNNENVKVIYNNKRANFDFDLLERFEAGLSLTGTEIKSIRAHHISLQRSFVQAKDNELWLICLLYTSPSPRDRTRSRMPSSA